MQQLDSETESDQHYGGHSPAFFPLQIFPFQGIYFLPFLKTFYLFILRERGKVGETEGEKHQCVVASRAPPAGDLVSNPGLCPDWELNW